ncbi:hypothetical protein ENBRE01_3360 [Enteropsectra breve]|nr:hypothetical protein ENBRE01_3360 [Enteropsectra breve]
MNLAHSSGGEGFADMTIQDLQEMIEERDLNEEELFELLDEQSNEYFENKNVNCDQDSSPFTPKFLQEGLAIGDKLLFYFMEHDPLFERRECFKNELQACLSSYMKIYKDLQTEGKQMLITDYIKNDSSHSTKEIKSILDYSDSTSDCEDIFDIVNSYEI